MNNGGGANVISAGDENLDPGEHYNPYDSYQMVDNWKPTKPSRTQATVNKWPMLKKVNHQLSPTGSEKPSGRSNQRDEIVPMAKRTSVRRNPPASTSFPPKVGNLLKALKSQNGPPLIAFDHLRIHITHFTETTRPMYVPQLKLSQALESAETEMQRLDEILIELNSLDEEMEIVSELAQTEREHIGESTALLHYLNQVRRVLHSQRPS